MVVELIYFVIKLKLIFEILKMLKKIVIIRKAM